MHRITLDPFPIEPWAADMRTAVQQVCDVGQQLLQRHRKANERAAAIADQWELAKRLEDERAGLERLFQSVRAIIESLEETRQKMHDDGGDSSALHPSLENSAHTIEEQLPRLEQALLTVRHAALDLLRWAKQWGCIEDSPLPDRYRESYAKLISYAPVFQPRLEAMQHDLVNLTNRANERPGVNRLLSGLSRYIGVVQSARALVRSIVDPPLDLEFHETDTFHQDWQSFDVAIRSQLATEFNDCCQFLLYDTADFHSRVENIRPQLGAEVEASLYSLAIDRVRVLFTVDEDPVFERITVTLLRVVDVSGFEQACAATIQALYSQMTDD
jgi:hypothetical protein